MISIDPIAFSVGYFPVRWYALMYIAGFLCTWAIGIWRIRKGEITHLSSEEFFDFLIAGFAGGIVGGRLGYVFFYDFSYYWNNPLLIVSPFDQEGQYRGIFGMSFHGAVLGSMVTLWVRAKIQKKGIGNIFDMISLLAPLGIALGRLGNFLNGELYGRVTNVWWSIDFGDGKIRHPSQLYEMFLEGIILFFFLWCIRKKKFCPGVLFFFFLIGYASTRFFCEFFREPDAHLGFFFLDQFTLGQFLSIGMLISGILGIWVVIKNQQSIFCRKNL